jgi:preprotein translocase subunit SecG
MIIAVVVLHVLACIVLVLSVLLQAGKGADMGAIFGGASTTIFGSSGAGNFLTRITTGAAIVFMVTSLTLTYGSPRGTTATLMPTSAPVPARPGAPGEGVAGAEGAAGAVPGEPAAGGESVPVPAPEGAPDAGAPAGEPPAAAPVAP